MKREASRFNYEKNRWAASAEQTHRWFVELERATPENVRARLDQSNAGPRGDITIGEVNMPIGFAEDWLAWHYTQKVERETGFRRSQLFWSRWTALAATAAAAVAAIGWVVSWAITAWRKG
jgi:hypothetical protein